MNDAGWNELFVKAIANFVLSASGYEPPSRAEALRREAFFENADADIGGFFARMVSGGASGILDAYDEPDGLEQEFADRNRASASRWPAQPQCMARRRAGSPTGSAVTG